VITEIIQKLVERIDLTEEEARAVMDFIMTAGATDSQIAGFLTALRMKGETAAELVGFARPIGHIQYLDGLRVCRGRRRDPHRQTREPIGYQ
jgi:anthranilate phosphoribosyltransferase